MTTRLLHAALIGCLLALSACTGDDVGPTEKALDGIWSTGHSLNGLELGFTLEWAKRLVRGSGNFLTVPPSTQCGNVTIAGSGTVTFAATRASPTAINGSLAFEGGPTVMFAGSIVNGPTRVDGDLIAPDGTACPFGFVQGQVP